MFFTVLTIQFSSNCQMDIGNQPMLKCLTGTTKIGIQQIKLSIHTSEENYENFIYCLLHIFKFVNCIFYHFIIMLYCTQY